MPENLSQEKVLPCGALGDLPVTFYCDSIEPDVGHKNIAELAERWASMWPSVEKAFRNEMEDYDHDFQEEDATPILMVSIPPEPWSKKSEWNISLEYEPFNGIWELEMSGLKKTGECSASF